MLYQPMPYPPPHDGAWTTRSAFPYDWERPVGKPWIVDSQALSRSARSRWDDRDFNPFDPRPYIERGYAPRDFTMSPGPFYDPPPRGAAEGALNPNDFSGAVPAALDRVSPRFVEHLSHCSATLTRCGERLARASSDAERREAAIEGHAAIAYCYGLLASEGISPPPAIFGEARSANDATRGNACKDAGTYIERMIEKYSRGSRGAWSDIGEGIDKLGGCYREVRENIGK